MPAAVELTRSLGGRIQLCIATAFTCPFDGAVPSERVLSIIDDSRTRGVDDVVLADTLGQAIPTHVTALVGATHERVPDCRIVFHGHDTWGLGRRQFTLAAIAARDYCSSTEHSADWVAARSPRAAAATPPARIFCSPPDRIISILRPSPGSSRLPSNCLPTSVSSPGRKRPKERGHGLTHSSGSSPMRSRPGADGLRAEPVEQRTEIEEKKMRAIQMIQQGGPEVLRLVELPEPVPGPGQVLIKVDAAAVNFADIARRRGDAYPMPTPTPFVLGAEVAGTVAAVGEGVDHLPIGAAVFGTVGEDASGGYAEFAIASAYSVVPIPAGLDPDVAAGIVVAGLTATMVLAEAAKVCDGDTVFVPAAAGGVGSYAVQIAKLLGSDNVIGAASTPAKRELALKFGQTTRSITPQTTGLRVSAKSQVVGESMWHWRCRDRRA